MKFLARYISSIFLKNYAVTALALTALYLFQAVMGQLLNHEYGADQVVIYNFFRIPDYLVQMTPPSVLMATVLTLSGLSRSNELIACHSIGIGLRQVMTVLVSLVFMIACFTLVLQDRILPPLFRARETYYWHEMKKRPDFFLDLKQDKIWYRSKNAIYNLRYFDPKTKTIHGMAVYILDDHFHLVEVIDAKQATFNDKSWILQDGTVTIFSKTEDFPLTTSFQEKELAIGETPKDFQEIEKKVEGLRLKELHKYIDRIKAAGTNTKSYEVQFHSKVSLSFIPLVMCILAVPFSTRSRREGGVARDLAICLAITFFYWLFYSIGLSLGSNGSIPPIVAAWLPSIVFAGLAGFLIYQRRR